MTGVPDLTSLINAPDDPKTVDEVIAEHRETFPLNGRVLGVHLPRHDGSQRLHLNGAFRRMRDNLGISVEKEKDDEEGLADVRFRVHYTRDGRLSTDAPSPRILLGSLPDSVVRGIQEILWDAGYASVVTLSRQLRISPHWNREEMSSTHEYRHIPLIKDEALRCLEVGLEPLHDHELVFTENRARLDVTARYWAEVPEFAAANARDLERWRGVDPSMVDSFIGAGIDDPETVKQSIRHSVDPSDVARLVNLNGFSWSVLKDCRSYGLSIDDMVQLAPLVPGGLLSTERVVSLRDKLGTDNARALGDLGVPGPLLMLAAEVFAKDSTVEVGDIAPWLLVIVSADITLMADDLASLMGRSVDPADLPVWHSVLSEFALTFAEIVDWMACGLGFAEAKVWCQVLEPKFRTAAVAREWIDAGYGPGQVLPWADLHRKHGDRHMTYGHNQTVMHHAADAWRTCVPGRSLRIDEIDEAMLSRITPPVMAAAARILHVSTDRDTADTVKS